MPLTAGEHTLLNEHDGCTKCQCFYIGHQSQTCNLGLPTAKGYKTLIITDVLAAKATATTTTKSVSATISTVDSDDKDIPIVAAVLPESLGGYTSDSDSDADGSCHDVSSPICVKHLFWNMV